MDYQSNSNKDKEKKEKSKEKDREKIEKVVTGEVILKPKGIGHKFKQIFFGGDFKQAMRFVAGEVLLPALRNLVVDSVTKGTERVVFGESSYRSRPTEYRPRIQYNNPLARPADPRTSVRLPDQPPRSFRSQRRDANDIILASREEADYVVERLIDIINKYDVASLADLNDLLGLPGSYLDNNWGWGALSNVEIRQVRNGYLIELPPLEEI